MSNKRDQKCVEWTVISNNVIINKDNFIINLRNNNETD
jgi:hypothetical protein